MIAPFPVIKCPLGNLRQTFGLPYATACATPTATLLELDASYVRGIARFLERVVAICLIHP